MFGKKDAASDLVNGPPFMVSTELVPYRLYAKRKSSVALHVKVRNQTKEVLLTSLVAELPQKLGFDEMLMTRQREIKIGEMQPGEEKGVTFNIYSGVGSGAGEYTLGLTTIAHYRDYGHVLNAVKKRMKVSVV